MAPAGGLETGPGVTHHLPHPAADHASSECLHNTGQTHCRPHFPEHVSLLVCMCINDCMLCKSCPFLDRLWYLYTDATDMPMLVEDTFGSSNTCAAIPGVVFIIQPTLPSFGAIIW